MAQRIPAVDRNQPTCSGSFLMHNQPTCITTCEGYTGLHPFPVFSLGFRHVTVNGFDNGFERGELHHCIRDLSTPQWVETFIESRSLVSYDLRGHK